MLFDEIPSGACERFHPQPLSAGPAIILPMRRDHPFLTALRRLLVFLLCVRESAPVRRSRLEERLLRR